MRILVVEDEFVIAQDIAWVIENELGYTVAGSVRTIEEALAAIAGGQLDGAVLDANLEGLTTECVAQALIEKKLPFFVVSGVAAPETLPNPLGAAPFLQKPYYEQELAQSIRNLTK
jgi:CheY-like chemotaxis protein